MRESDATRAQARQIDIGSALLARKECVSDLDQVKQLVRVRCTT